MNEHHRGVSEHERMLAMQPPVTEEEMERLKNRKAVEREREGGQEIGTTRGKHEQRRHRLRGGGSGGGGGGGGRDGGGPA